MKFYQKFFFLLIIVGVQGCVNQPKFTKEEQNITKPMENSTYFSDAFEKLNTLLFLFGQKKYKFQVKQIENMTSNKNGLPEDSRSFLRTPIILHMHNMELIAYAPIYNMREAQVAGLTHFPKVEKNLPKLVIGGAITQFDKGILSENINMDLDAEFGSGKGDSDFRLDHDRSDSISQIALDLNVFSYEDRSYIAGVATHNKIEIHKKRKKNRLGLFINGSGIGYSKYATLQQSKDEALRILSEYSLLQLLGRLYNIPYWRCTTPNLPPDKLLIKRKKNRFNNAKKIAKIKLLEELIKFYGYKVNNNGKMSKYKVKVLTEISKEYSFKTTNFLSSDFYIELYNNAPFFKTNLKKEKKKRLKTKFSDCETQKKDPSTNFLVCWEKEE